MNKKIELAQTIVIPGGWYYGKKWLTEKLAKECQKRWARRSETAGVRDENDWIEHQCGGCRFMAATGADYGICWNKSSPLDGCIVFEHGGCLKHSYFETKELE